MSDYSITPINRFGVTLCGRCHAVLMCDKCGDMPDNCPNCGCLADWKNWCAEITVEIAAEEGANQ